MFARHNYEAPVLLPSELEFYKARSTEARVLAIAQAIVHAAPEWTPLIEVTPLDSTRKEAVIAASLKKCEEANEMCYTLVQRKGDNVKGDVVCYEGHKKDLDWLKVRRPKPKGEEMGESDDRPPHSGSREALFHDPTSFKRKRA